MDGTDELSATDRGYQVLKRRIISGELAAGERLREVDLAQSIGVSRTPVREALRRLQLEGFVHIEANRGARVASRPPGDLADILEVRSVLEDLGARKAARHASPQLIDRLARIANAMERAAQSLNEDALERVAVLNDEFHNVIMEASCSPRLITARMAVLSGAVMTGTWQRFTDEERERSFAHHRELIAALDAGNAEWAGSVARAHLLAARSLYIDETRDQVEP